MEKEYRKLKNLVQDIIANGYDLNDVTAAYKAMSSNKKKIEDAREKVLHEVSLYLAVLRPDADDKQINKMINELRDDLKYFEIIAEEV